MGERPYARQPNRARQSLLSLEPLEQACRVPRRRRRLVVAEVDVDRLECGGHRGGECCVWRFAAAEKAEWSRMLEVADADGSNLRKLRLDAVPRRVLEIECEA
jgi:hypothetical protein